MIDFISLLIAIPTAFLVANAVFQNLLFDLIFDAWLMMRNGHPATGKTSPSQKTQDPAQP